MRGYYIDPREFPKDLAAKESLWSSLRQKQASLKSEIGRLAKEDQSASERSYKAMIAISGASFITILIIQTQQTAVTFGDVALYAFLSLCIGLVATLIFIKAPTNQLYSKRNDLQLLDNSIEALVKNIESQTQAVKDQQRAIEYQQRAELEQKRQVKLRQAISGWISMSGHEFEKQVGVLYRNMGYSVEITKGSGDGGVDLFAEKDGVRWVVQCKNHQKPVGPSPIRDLYGVMNHLNNPHGIFISSGGYTEGARDFAKEKIKLLDVTDLVAMNNQVLGSHSSPREEEKVEELDDEQRRKRAEQKGLLFYK